MAATKSKTKRQPSSVVHIAGCAELVQRLRAAAVKAGMKGAPVALIARNALEAWIEAQDKKA